MLYCLNVGKCTPVAALPGEIGLEPSSISKQRILCQSVLGEKSGSISALLIRVGLPLLLTGFFFFFLILRVECGIYFVLVPDHCFSFYFSSTA